MKKIFFKTFLGTLFFLLIFVVFFSTLGIDIFKKLKKGIEEKIIKPVEKKIVKPAEKAIKEKVVKPAEEVIELGKGIIEQQKIEKLTRGINFNTSRWRELPDDMPLYKAVFLGSHNSFSYPPVFRLYSQQTLNITEQLNFGVRGLMPDIHRDKKDGEMKLCHESCGGAAAKVQTGKEHPNYQTFTQFLSQVKLWLNAHPKEIIFMFLEEYDLKEGELDKLIENVRELTELLVTPKLWEEYGLNEKAKAEKVTIGQLRKKGKRLFIFKQGSQDTKYTMSQWNRIAENQYSTVDPKKVCNERDESAKQGAGHYRPLYLMNYFKEITETIDQSLKLHQYKSMEEIIDKCTGHFHKRPNFIFIDRVESLGILERQGKKNLMDLINDWNKKK